MRSNESTRPRPRPHEIEAVLLDVDGTLYDAATVRTGMFVKLALAHALRPRTGLRVARTIRAYRRAHERLRDERIPHTDLARTQLTLAAEELGVAPEELAPTIERWFEQAPLEFVARAVRPGLRSFLEGARRLGVRLAVVSDYPTQAKLRALAVERMFDVQVCAQQTDVGRLKPDPRGLDCAIRRLGVRPAAAVYVGDRRDVDAEAAEAAGMACVILDRADDFRALFRLLFERA